MVFHSKDAPPEGVTLKIFGISETGVSESVPGVIEVKPDGRTCRCCHRSDNDQDHSNPLLFIAWAYPPNKDGSNRGRVCWYCFRVYDAQHAPKNMSLAVLGVKLGQDSEFNKEFHFFRDAVVKFVADRGANIRSSRARWTDLRTSILTYKKEEVEELQAPDSIQLLKNYVQEYGQPEHNGLGHQRIIYRGHDCVITGDRWWRSCSHI
jgi:hypothetical protein